MNCAEHAYSPTPRWNRCWTSVTRPACACPVASADRPPSSGMTVLGSSRYQTRQTPKMRAARFRWHTLPVNAKSAIQTLARQARQAQARPLTGCCQRRV